MLTDQFDSRLHMQISTDVSVLNDLDLSVLKFP